MEGSGYYSSKPYHDDDNYDGGYGYNYRNYRLPNDTSGFKGKIEQKYWRSKQKVIEKFGKDQDEFVIAGDAEVDARLEAFQHIKMTSIQLMTAIDIFQNKIFALSQDENDMGRFLKDQGAIDKTKAGKMMIAVGKAQSYAAQQRLALRAPLARLHSEIDTFRFRAIQDTQITVDKMEQARSDYRARLLWMADISKELDPDHFKRLDKFRDVQLQVKSAKKLFDKLKGDVIQKIDLLSASRCNLLSATLEPYQTAMIKFLSSTAKSYNEVYQQHQGYPSYQFNILKHIMPNNGIADEDDDELLDGKEKGKKKESHRQRIKKKKEIEEMGEEIKEDQHNSKDDSGVVEDKLISFDTSPSEEDVLQHVQNNDCQGKKIMSTDLLGSLDSSDDVSPGFGEYTSEDVQEKKNGDGFEDLLGGFEENSEPSLESGSTQPSLLGGLEDENHASVLSSMAASDAPVPTVDDLLFGLSAPSVDDSQKSDLDILSDVLTNQSLGVTDTEHNESFSGQWQSMFGSQDVQNDIVPNAGAENIDVATEGQMYMPSFLLDQMRKADPMSVLQGSAPKNSSSVKDSGKLEKTPPIMKKKKPTDKKDMSAWFNLFADLDPLSNPDAIGDRKDVEDGKQAC